MNVTRILVIMLRYLGDVLLATPVTRALREHYPRAHIAMAVNPGTSEVLEGNGDIDEIVIVERGPLSSQLGLLNRLRAQGFDTVIDLTDGDRSAILARWTGAPVRIGFNEEHHWRGLLYTRTVRGDFRHAHRVDRNVEALRPLGVEPTARTPVIHISDDERRQGEKVLEEADLDPRATGANGLAVLHPGARYWFKAWAPDRFAQVADRLAADGWSVVIGGGAEERPLAEDVQAQCRSAVRIIAGRTSVKQYAAIIEQSRLFIGNDNGPMHIAAALGIPVLALFGPTDPAVWGPYGGRSVVCYKGLDCRACFYPGCRLGPQSCMNLISVDEVCDAANRLVDAGASTHVRSTHFVREPQ